MSHLISLAIFALLAVHVTAQQCGVSSLSAEQLEQAAKQTRIVGGRNALPNEIPWQISLQYMGSHSCGGTIISPWWILTAAHCFGNSMAANRYTIVTGLYSQKQQTAAGVQKIAAGTIFRHPMFSQTFGITNDIALIKLASPITLDGKNAVACCLPPSVLNTDNVNSTVSGWGSTSVGSNRVMPDILQVANNLNLPDATCAAKWGSTSWKANQMICAQDAVQAPCVGDSGGPLTMQDPSSSNWMVIGCVSFGESTCKPGAPSRPPVYTRVSYFLDSFILPTMSANP